MTVRVILTDIEGTTSSISFVHDVLFPYAAARMADFVAAHANDPAVREQLQATAAEAGQPDADDAAIIETLLRWIREDRKATPLKQLQGMIWKTGFENGDFTAHLYEDAHRNLKAWHEAGTTMAVYSSGSIGAQKLFFGHCDFGDITPWFSAHFDTTTGPKKEADSYAKIQAALNVPAGDILFLSDIVEELDAAASVGMQTQWLIRDEADELPADSPHRPVRSFDDITIN